jgi:cysteine-rich repeat protein
MTTMRTTIAILASCLLFACGGGGTDADDTGDDVGPGECGDGTTNTGEECDDGNTTAGDGCDATCQLEPGTALRLTSMEIRDPHMFAPVVGDVTTTVNGSIADGITMDASDPPDGQLDLSFILLFRPWNPSGAGGSVDAIAGADCAAPSGMSCVPDPAATIVEATGTNGDTTCLAPGAGTTGGYSPPITTPSGRCFATDKHQVMLTLGPVALTLEETQIGGTYSASGHTVSNGLMVGFITEAQADATTLPEDLPLVGGQPLSTLLRDEDMDSGPGGTGWWFYMNFSASEVTYTE